MKKLKPTKRLILFSTALAALAVPLFAGLAVQAPALAQEPGSQVPPTRPTDDPNEYLPIVKVAPIYPQRAAARGLEGYVVVSYTVLPDGSTGDIEVVESSATLFEQSAIDSAAKYKYKPRTVNGQPVAVPGVHTRIVYELANNEDVPTAPDAE